MENRNTHLSVYRRLLLTRRALRDWRTEAARSALHAKHCRDGNEPDLMALADTYALAAILDEECAAVASISARTPAPRASHVAIATELAALARDTRESHRAMQESLLRPSAQD